jgi:phospholipase C
MISLAALLLAFVPVARAADPGPSFKKAVIVILENTSYDQALAQPFMAGLAKQGALLSNYHAVTHPSQPNYVALISGSNAGVPDDKPVNLSRRHLGDLLEAAGKSWRVFAEAYPGNCFLGATAGKYARKHVPFLSFKSVQLDPARCARVTDASGFADAARGGSLPDFSLYIPDLNDDGHDTGAPYADDWLKRTIGPLLPAWPADTLLVVTFDEDDRKNPDNQVYAALYGGGVAPGSESQDSLSHYSLLKTIEQSLGLGSLGAGDASAAPITGVWR